jgi:hypothetical protein
MKRTDIIKGQCYNVVIEKKQRLVKVLGIRPIAQPPVQDHFARKQAEVFDFHLMLLAEGRAVVINDASKFRSVA